MLLSALSTATLHVPYVRCSNVFHVANVPPQIIVMLQILLYGHSELWIIHFSDVKCGAAMAVKAGTVSTPIDTLRLQLET